jgi:hypothetical protein
VTKLRNKRKTQRSFEYDVCLSFAGEDRSYVRKVASELRAQGVRVFYDQYAQADMWGKDLFTHLGDIYQNAARFCVLFASKNYARRIWTNHERESAQARAIRQHAEYLLPARFDHTKIPGLRPTVGYVDAASLAPEELARLIIAKIGDRPREMYFPPVPDRLFARTRARTARSRDTIERRARDFYSALERMRTDERRLVLATFLHSCCAELRQNVHAKVDLLRRVTGFSEGKIHRLAGGLRSLGVYAQLREDEEDDGYLGDSKTLVLEWHDASADPHIGGNATGVAYETVRAACDSYCWDCSLPALERLDFSALANATLTPDVHEGPSGAQTEQAASTAIHARRGSKRRPQVSG